MPNTLPAKDGVEPTLKITEIKAIGKRILLMDSTMKKDRKTILLADDNSGVLMLAKYLLEQAGYAVNTAEDGQKALKAFVDLNIQRKIGETRGEIDAAVTDFHMPDMDGLELITRLRIYNPSLPVLLIAGAAEEVVDEAEARNIPVPPILDKPFNNRTFLKRIADLFLEE